MFFLEETTLGKLYESLQRIGNKEDRNKAIDLAKNYYNLSDMDVGYLHGRRIIMDDQSNAATLANQKHAQKIIKKYKNK